MQSPWALPDFPEDGQDRLCWNHSMALPSVPCLLGVKPCRSAAERGNLKLLQALRGLQPPCPWDSSVSQAALHCPHPQVLQWMLDQVPPCPISLQDAHNALAGHCFRTPAASAADVACQSKPSSHVRGGGTSWPCRHAPVADRPAALRDPGSGRPSLQQDMTI